MNSTLLNIEPKSVFNYFEEISSIPRCSKSEKAISDYLYNFGKNLGLETIQDEALNIIIKKPATNGYENSPTVILQGHMDMVCEKNRETIHDFEKDNLKLRIQDDMIYATGTTLGADNGIAVAYSMAILGSNNIEHPPLEVLITVDEEAGMNGAKALDGNLLSGKYMLNLDSDEEDVLLVSCAGGIRANLSLPINYTAADKSLNAYSVNIKGLQGGHSGSDIDKGRGNSNKLLGRVLHVLNDNIDFDLACISGGSKDNAIPREAEAIILTNDNCNLQEVVKKMHLAISNELKSSDPNFELSIDKIENNFQNVFDDITKQKVIMLIDLIPNGVQTMSMDIKGLVESSTNLGVIQTDQNNIIFRNAVRSSVESLKVEITNRISSLAYALHANLVLEGDYPGWAYNKDSKLRDICVDVYKNIYKKDPIVTAIHAGLECGLLKEKLKDVDIISFGPNMYDCHTPNEHLSISSTQRTWNYIIELLKSIK
jgi:dipeptidase D